MFRINTHNKKNVDEQRLIPPSENEKNSISGALSALIKEDYEKKFKVADVKKIRLVSKKKCKKHVVDTGAAVSAIIEEKYIADTVIPPPIITKKKTKKDKKKIGVDKDNTIQERLKLFDKELELYSKKIKICEYMIENLHKKTDNINGVVNEIEQSLSLVVKMLN